VRTPGALDGDAELRLAAESGLMALTGHADAAPVAPPAGMVAGLEALTTAIRHWSVKTGTQVQVDWDSMLTGRASILGLGRQGRHSANGSCRLLKAGNGWVAINLARPDDVAAVDAVVGEHVTGEPLEALEHAAARMTAAQFVSRVRLLGLPGTALSSATPGGWMARRLWPTSTRRLEALRVVDLSSMWAGPLVSLILTSAGASVTKIESATRPDAAREVPDFYRLLHPPGQHEVVLDFSRDRSRRQLRRLVAEADVVIESSRPRALEQLGVGPLHVEPRPGKVWISITGYGRESPGRDWVAFGDDAAVAGGLVGLDAGGDPVFCGDAVADPVTGMTAAAAAFQALAEGGGVLLDVSMARCAASLVAVSSVTSTLERRVERSPDGGWQIDIDGVAVSVRHPRLPAPLSISTSVPV
jgi:CoA-transferase family III